MNDESGKKKTFTAAAVIIVLSVSVLIFGKKLYDMNRVIGTYSGTEYEVITIGGVTYKADYDNDYSSSDRGRVLGKVIFEKGSDGFDPMYIWTVKGTDEYIYALWLYDGTFYRKVE